MQKLLIAGLLLVSGIPFVFADHDNLNSTTFDLCFANVTKACSDEIKHSFDTHPIRNNYDDYFNQFVTQASILKVYLAYDKVYDYDDPSFLEDIYYWRENVGWEEYRDYFEDRYTFNGTDIESAHVNNVIQYHQNNTRDLFNMTVHNQLKTDLNDSKTTIKDQKSQITKLTDMISSQMKIIESWVDKYKELNTKYLKLLTPDSTKTNNPPP